MSKYNLYIQVDYVRNKWTFISAAENDKTIRRAFENRLDMDEKAIGIPLKREDYGVICIGQFDDELIFEKNYKGEEIPKQPITLNEQCYIVGKEQTGVKPRDYTESNMKPIKEY